RAGARGELPPPGRGQRARGQRGRAPAAGGADRLRSRAGRRTLLGPRSARRATRPALAWAAAPRAPARPAARRGRPRKACWNGHLLGLHGQRGRERGGRRCKRARGRAAGRRVARVRASAPPRVPAHASAPPRNLGVLRRTPANIRAVRWGEWIRTIEVEPSLYAADFSRLGEQVETLLRAECRVLHFDVGDGHFIPPITAGPVVLKWIAPVVHRVGGVLDCHLMVEAPERHVPQFAEAGADSVTVHFEACPDLPGVVALAREHGLQVGMAFNPETGVDEAARAAQEAAVDIVLCMSIHPGYSGQAFMPESLDRIRELRGLLPKEMHIQVDGGVGPDKIRDLCDAGATLFVAATAIFGREDLPRAYRRLVHDLAGRTAG